MKKTTTRWACVPKIKTFPKLSKPLIDWDKNIQNVFEYQLSHASKVQLGRTNIVQIGSLIHIWKDLFKGHKKLRLHVWLGFLFLELWMVIWSFKTELYRNWECLGFKNMPLWERSHNDLTKQINLLAKFWHKVKNSKSV